MCGEQLDSNFWALALPLKGSRHHKTGRRRPTRPWPSPCAARACRAFSAAWRAAAISTRYPRTSSSRRPSSCVACALLGGCQSSRLRKDAHMNSGDADRTSSESGRHRPDVCAKTWQDRPISCRRLASLDSGPTWSELAQSWADFDRVRPRLRRIWAETLTELGPIATLIWATAEVGLAQVWTDFGQIVSGSPDSGSNLGRHRAILAQSSVRIRPTLVRLGWDRVRPSWAKLGRLRPNLRQVWPTSAKFGQNRAHFGRFGPNLGRLCATSGQTWVGGLQLGLRT